MSDSNYDGTPVQGGLEHAATTLTDRDPQFSMHSFHEMVVVGRTYVDEPGNRSRTHIEYTCRDLATGDIFHGVQRMQQSAGVDDGEDLPLRPASKLLPHALGQRFSNQTKSRDVDGDRVIVVFLKGSVYKPVIIGTLTHRSATYGAKKADGERRLLTHKGTSVEIKQNGEYVIKHKSGAEVTLLDSGDVALTPAPNKHVFLGDTTATENLVLGQQFKTFAQDLIDALLTATYPTGMGPSGPMLPSSATTLQTLRASLDTLLSDVAFTQKSKT